MNPEPTDIASLLDSYVKQLKAKGVPNDKIKAVLLKFREQLSGSAEPSMSPATPQGRPYRYKNQSWQVVNGKWINAQTNQPAPMFYVTTLNTLKKKVDAQRATGNLTDSKKPRNPTL